jgi:hypothetical protein
MAGGAQWSKTGQETLTQARLSLLDYSYNLVDLGRI